MRGGGAPGQAPRAGDVRRARGRRADTPPTSTSPAPAPRGANPKFVCIWYLFFSWDYFVFFLFFSRWSIFYPAAGQVHVRANSHSGRIGRHPNARTHPRRDTPKRNDQRTGDQAERKEDPAKRPDTRPDDTNLAPRPTKPLETPRDSQQYPSLYGPTTT